MFSILKDRWPVLCWSLLLGITSGCSERSSDGHHHSHGQSGHVVTSFTGKTELFVEFPKLVKGKGVSFVVHLTRLRDYKPVRQGKIVVELAGAGKPLERFSTSRLAVPGIFKPFVRPRYAGKRQLRIRFDAGAYQVVHRLGAIQVSANHDEAHRLQLKRRDSGELISYSKEQQWKFDFAVVQVGKRALHATITATGTIRAPSDRTMRVTATAPGRLRAAGRMFPYVGMKVNKGQVLAEIIPVLGDSVDIASLELDLEKKKSELKLAAYNRRRLEALFQQKVIARKKLIAAQSKEEIARAEYNTIKRRIRQQKTGEVHLGRQVSGVILRARISGTVAHVHKTPGTHLKLGEEIFHLVNTGRLWLESNVPEHDIGRLVNPVGAWFEISGYKQPFNTLRLNGKVVSIGSAIDKITRTLPLLIAFDNPGGKLKVGMFAESHIITSARSEAVAVPVSAVIDDNGKHIVYVQKDGEHFEARQVRTGIRDDRYIEIVAGLKPGEYIVARGGYLLRLAATSPATIGHGHTH